MALVQHVLLLDFVGTNDTHALYQQSLEETGREPLKVLMPLHVYEDMKQQEQVTVAIRPGSAFTDLDVAFQTPPGE